MTTAESIQFWALLVTTLGILIALGFSIWQAQLTNKQMKLNNQQLKLMEQQMKVDLFADYTKRYQQIKLNFPENINDDDFDLYKLKQDDEELYDKIMRHMHIYFDLCSEEYFLDKNSQIDKSVWKEWSEGIEYTFTKKAFIDVPGKLSQKILNFLMISLIG